MKKRRRRERSKFLLVSNLFRRSCLPCIHFKMYAVTIRPSHNKVTKSVSQRVKNKCCYRAKILFLSARRVLKAYKTAFVRHLFCLVYRKMAFEYKSGDKIYNFRAFNNIFKKIIVTHFILASCFQNVHLAWCDQYPPKKIMHLLRKFFFTILW